ncbi:histidine phosphatase family protein [Lutimaribacter sp. EGI FJ00015]|uniref:Histidine phosphatase family protein n=1 Tax=Lutimaribacter degradans TaxID=2945989 RepID=A0ACC5ZVY4_9RHOB|nr:histidine phosphatase family protein [Lutimaribacter sp. EGI FJ00013]MCM2562523.1 histidine phosphatase family protein [Lutimaribacter sp. EGI FJ00013]MCO0613680.1 histidine phosphatase family protein [Lutimaribacter sp. EGI FJ00015]MCO0636837.1 histidine phosphatase family protein [Lutimaribacter sp. EGI FJ00014]
MAELIVIRHAQASFGAANYDQLSDLGHRQSRALGKALAAQGLRPDAVVIGSMTRHRETLEGVLAGLGMTAAPEIHPGLNEFDFTALLNARFHDAPGPENMHTDRKTHFRTLRETVLAWQRDEIENPPESWGAFVARVEEARQTMLKPDADQVLAVSSGGPIGQLVAAALETPPARQIELQLQTRNCGVTRFVYSRRGAFYFHGFNETPHINAANAQELLTYS